MGSIGAITLQACRQRAQIVTAELVVCRAAQSSGFQGTVMAADEMQVICVERRTDLMNPGL